MERIDTDWFARRIAQVEHDRTWNVIAALVIFPAVALWMFWPAMQFVWHPDITTWQGWLIWLLALPVGGALLAIVINRLQGLFRP